MKSIEISDYGDEQFAMGPDPGADGIGIRSTDDSRAGGLAQQRPATLETQPMDDNVDEGLAAITPKAGVAAHAKRGMIEENVFLLPDGTGGPSPFTGGPVEQPPIYRS